MTPERWQRMKTLFHAALERPVDERARFLGEACGDDAEARAHLERLLDANADAGSFLETPAAPEPTVWDVFEAALTRAQGTRPAFLDEACGSNSELRREVESLLASHDEAGGKPETGSRRIGPYRILDTIAHGGMGTVYRAVRDDDAFRKTVALKLVRGGRGSDYIERRFRQERQILARLQHPNIAAIFDAGTTDDGHPYFVMEHVEGRPITEFCAAAGLATRERLILLQTVCSAVQYAHQNLVIHRDLKPGNILVTADGTPKLLDFGIAKLLAAGLDPEEAPTATLLAVMTPEYASPEQVKGAAVTTASDVYSLGVLLYELLAGQRPYAVPSDSLPEIVRVVCETEPPPPSVAADRKAAERGAAATPRRPAPSELRGDLDTIVMKALRKEPSRRYASPQELSEDLGRHLKGLTVRARPDTLGYRVSKFVRRHTAGVAASVLLLTTLVGGVVATARQAAIAEANRARAERRFADVRKLANSFLFDFHDAIQHLPGATNARKLVVSKALEYLDGLAAEAAGDEALQAELATAYQKVGDVQGNQFQANLGDTAGAAASYGKALAIRRALSAAAPGDLERKRELADTLTGLAEIQYMQMDLTMTLERLREALALREALLAASPGDGKARRELALTLDRLTYALANTGDLAAEGEAGRRALALREALAAADPSAAAARQELAQSYRRLGDILAKSGDHAGAIEAHRRAIALWESLVADGPTNAANRHDLSNSYVALGVAFSRAGNLPGALTEFRRALVSMESIVAEDPHNAQARWQQALDHNALAYAQTGLGRPHESIRHLQASLRIFETLSRADPANEMYLYGVANTLQLTGDAYVKRARDPRASPADRTGHWRSARTHYERSAAIYQGMRERGTLQPIIIPDTEAVARGLAECDAALGPSPRASVEP